MKLDSLIVIRHSLRPDTFTSEQFLSLIEQLYDDEQILLKEGKADAEIHNYESLYNVVVKYAVSNQLLVRFAGIINNVNTTKLSKIYQVCTALTKPQLDELVSMIQSSNGFNDSFLSPIDPELLNFNQLSFKQCYLLSKYLVGILENKYDFKKQVFTIHLHCSPYRRCIQSSLYMVKAVNHLFGLTNSKNSIRFELRIDNFLSEYYYKSFFEKDRFNQEGGIVQNIANGTLSDAEIQEKIIRDNEAWLLNELQSFSNASYDVTWDKNLFGKHGPFKHGTLITFTKRCINGGTRMLEYFSAQPDSKPNEVNVLCIITHGAIINNYLNSYLNAANETPLTNNYKFIDIPPSSFILLKNVGLNGNDDWLLNYSNINFPCFKKRITHHGPTLNYDNVIKTSVFKRFKEEDLDDDLEEIVEDGNDDGFIIIQRNNSLLSFNPIEKTKTRTRKNTILTTTSPDEVEEVNSIINNSSGTPQKYTSFTNVDDVVASGETDAKEHKEVALSKNKASNSVYNFSENNFLLNNEVQQKPSNRSIFEKSVSSKSSFNVISDNFYPAGNFSMDNIVSGPKDNRNADIKRRLSAFKFDWSKKTNESADKARVGRPRASSAVFFLQNDSDSDSDSDSNSDSSSDSDSDSDPKSPDSGPTGKKSAFESGNDNELDSNVKISNQTEIPDVIVNDAEEESYEIPQVLLCPEFEDELKSNRPIESIGRKFSVSISAEQGDSQGENKEDVNDAEYLFNQEEKFEDTFMKSSADKKSDAFIEDEQKNTVKRGRFETISFPVKQETAPKTSIYSNSKTGHSISHLNGLGDTQNNQQRPENKEQPGIAGASAGAWKNGKIILIKNTNSYKSLAIEDIEEKNRVRANKKKQELEKSEVDEYVENFWSKGGSKHTDSAERKRASTANGGVTKLQTNTPVDNTQYFRSPITDKFFESLNSLNSLDGSGARYKEESSDRDKGKIIFVSNSSDTTEHKVF